MISNRLAWVAWHGWGDFPHWVLGIDGHRLSRITLHIDCKVSLSLFDVRMTYSVLYIM